MWENYYMYPTAATVLPHVTSLLGGFPFVWIIFLVALAVYLLYSLILGYHWFRYGMNPLTVLIMMGIYAGVSVILLGVLYSSASSIASLPHAIPSHVSYQ